MPSYLITHNKSDCCGCGVCVSACPKQCISMTEDDYGFIYPEIDSLKCLNCDLCKSVCVYGDNHSYDKRNTTFFAGHSKNDIQMMSSSSGGVFPLICGKIVDNNGVVFSVTRDSDNIVKYIKIDKKEEIPLIQGSKYVQADTGIVFKRIKEELNLGKTVLFSGCPCHVAALKSYVSGNCENLYLVSVICHGVPSQKMFSDYIRFLEKKHHGQLTDINFRDKEKRGWSITLSYIIEKHGKKQKYYESSKISAYFIGFLNGLTVRESCHNCLFAGLNHESDIMLGDFWGYQEKYASLKSDLGFSIFSINTAKGEQLLSLIKTDLKYGAVDTSDVLNSLNTNLKGSTSINEKYDDLMRDYANHGFEYIAEKYLRPDHPVKEKLKNSLPTFVLKLISKIKRRK